MINAVVAFDLLPAGSKATARLHVTYSTARAEPAHPSTKSVRVEACFTTAPQSRKRISDQISKRQIGNGMFLVFVAGIVAGLSRTLGLVDPFAVLTYAALHVAVVGVVSHGYRRAIAPAQLGWTLETGPLQETAGDR